ncbi:Fork head domain protein [Aphelenchoides besseyi]|nr:Fork head domain protein [Aphelenchoides besseyi]KAI6217145.1 Fork head domain protein [Aphelenchoides besseyi]
MSLNNSAIFPKTQSIELPNEQTNFLVHLLNQLQQSSANTPTVSDSSKTTELFGAHLKPPHSYIGLIAIAILSRKEKRMLLSEIYEWIANRYPYFRHRGSGWRNSIRHNLSLNDCFVKDVRAPNGKGHYWTIHPANLPDFSRGDFRRKHAQYKVKTHDIREFALHAHSAQVRQWCLEQMNQTTESSNKKIVGFDVNSLLDEPKADNRTIESPPPSLIPFDS